MYYHQFPLRIIFILRVNYKPPLPGLLSVGMSQGWVLDPLVSSPGDAIHFHSLKSHECDASVGMSSATLFLSSRHPRPPACWTFPHLDVSYASQTCHEWNSPINFFSPELTPTHPHIRGIAVVQIKILGSLNFSILCRLEDSAWSSESLSFQIIRSHGAPPMFSVCFLTEGPRIALSGPTKLGPASAPYTLLYFGEQTSSTRPLWTLAIAVVRHLILWPGVPQWPEAPPASSLPPTDFNIAPKLPFITVYMWNDLLKPVLSLT